MLIFLKDEVKSLTTTIKTFKHLHGTDETFMSEVKITFELFNRE